MSREIKFRAWDGERMVYFETLTIGLTDKKKVSPYVYFKKDTFDGHVKLHEHKDMEFTGQKDAIGTDIYEGDLLHFPEAGEVVEVTFEDAAFRILFSFDDESLVLTEKLLDANYDVRVVGNIYENEDPQKWEQLKYVNT